MSFVKDPKSPYYGEVDIYDIYNRTQGIFIKVHTSRCLIFKGEAIPTTSSSLVTVEMEYWGLSVLNAIWTRLKNFGATEQGLANLMYEIVIGKYKLSNLAEILANNNTNAVYTRLEVINASKSLINAVLLGENEDYTRDTANLAGIPEMIDRIIMVLSGISGIPLTRLFGRSPAGLNATGESDLTTYYETVSANQGLMLNKPLHKLINIVNSYLKVVNEEISFEFNPVREPSQKELLEMRKMQAEIDAIYLDRGVILPEEVARNRFGSTNQFQTQVDLEGERESTEGMPEIE